MQGVEVKIEVNRTVVGYVMLAEISIFDPMKQEVERKDVGFYWVKRVTLPGEPQEWEVAYLKDADNDTWDMMGDDSGGHSDYFTEIGIRIKAPSPEIRERL